MQKVCDELTTAFRKHSGILTHELYSKIIKKHKKLFDDEHMSLYILQAMGYPIDLKENHYRLKTYFTPIEKQSFCIIDIETNGSNPNNSQIIEVGAVIIKNRKITKRYRDFVKCDILPEYITKVTGIQHKDLKYAPSKAQVLIKLKEFMKDYIFVAHNANFDYSFLNSSFEQVGLGGLCNPKLCTIDLGHRTFEAERYGLAFLNHFLNINTPLLHRAYNDAVTTSKVLEHEFNNLPSYVKSADELLHFSISAKKEPSETKNR